MANRTDSATDWSSSAACLCFAQKHRSEFLDTSLNSESLSGHTEQMVPDELLFRSETFQKTNPYKDHERSQEVGMAPYVECQPGITARARAGMSWTQKVTKQCLTSFNLLTR